MDKRCQFSSQCTTVLPVKFFRYTFFCIIQNYDKEIYDNFCTVSKINIYMVYMINAAIVQKAFVTVVSVLRCNENAPFRNALFLCNI